ncbi:MAG: hypothetical protein ABF899_08175, partial [Oenococcus sp.]
DSTWQSEKKAHQHYFETATHQENFKNFVASVSSELGSGHGRIKSLQSNLKKEIELYFQGLN